MPISGEAQAALVTAINEHVTNLINSLSQGTLNVVFEVLNETKYGLRHDTDKQRQSTSSIDPGISQFIYPPTTTDIGTDNAIIPFQSSGLDGVFTLVCYDVCTIPPYKRKEYSAWTKLGFKLVFGCLHYSTGRENSKYYIKGFAQKKWDSLSWDDRFHDMDIMQNGTHTSQTVIGSGATTINAWGKAPFYRDQITSQGGPERTTVYTITLQD